jgi:hypothetical protein
MPLESVTIAIEGVAPLLMHNGQLADPMNEHTRNLKDAIKKAKKTKTDAAFAAAYKTEFLGGLYLDENKEPCLPGEVIEATIIEGAKKSKQGKDAKAGLMVEGLFPLKYKGPRDVEALWEKKFFKTCGVRVGQSRIMRTRPLFPTGWSCDFLVHYNSTLINRKDLLKYVEEAGNEVGIGDFRPRFGRFIVVGER